CLSAFVCFGDRLNRKLHQNILPSVAQNRRYAENKNRAVSIKSRSSPANDPKIPPVLFQDENSVYAFALLIYRMTEMPDSSSASGRMPTAALTTTQTDNRLMTVEIQMQNAVKNSTPTSIPACRTNNAVSMFNEIPDSIY